MTGDQKAALKRNWRFRWLGELFLFAHIEYQKALWIDQSIPNEIGWFSEDVCKYFDDLSLDDDYDYQIKNKIITQQELDIIFEFHKIFKEYIELTNISGSYFDDDKVIDDENWLKVVEVGKTSWHNLKKVITNQEELLHMQRLEKSYLIEKKD